MSEAQSVCAFVSFLPSGVMRLVVLPSEWLLVVLVEWTGGFGGRLAQCRAEKRCVIVKGGAA